jgi:structure-specific endonuclease subunit SLX1
MSTYVCYLLRLAKADSAAARTYVGITNNLTRRLRQHNGEIKGGALSTKMARGSTG